MKKRIFKLVTATIILIVAGLLYLVLNKLTGFAIPCPIRFVTGLYCPGCGVTGMCIALSKLDFAEAFSCNQALMLALPFAVYFIIAFTYRYIKYGSLKPKKIENIILYVLIVYFVLFGIIRNIPVPVLDVLRPYS